MRLIVGATNNTLSFDQPADGLRRVGGKSLRTLDLGGETLQLREVVAVSSRRIDEKGRKPKNERGRVAPPR